MRATIARPMLSERKPRSRAGLARSYAYADNVRPVGICVWATPPVKKPPGASAIAKPLFPDWAVSLKHEPSGTFAPGNLSTFRPGRMSASMRPAWRNGRRSGLKIRGLLAWGFESPGGHKTIDITQQIGIVDWRLMPRVLFVLGFPADIVRTSDPKAPSSP
jgi:hypothetical protein